ncbi:MAG: hypothetical protein ABR521_03500 [Gaiellaceae bacterium]
MTRLMGRLTIMAAVGCGTLAATALAMPGARPGIKPHGAWTYMQGITSEKGDTSYAAMEGTLRLYASGAFADKRVIKADQTYVSSLAGRYTLSRNKLRLLAYEKGRRAPSKDQTWTYLYSQKLLALSLSKKYADGSTLAYLLYYKGTEKLARCGGKDLKPSLRC